MYYSIDNGPFVPEDLLQIFRSLLKTTINAFLRSILPDAETKRGQTLTITKEAAQSLPASKSRREKFEEKFQGLVS